MTTRHPLTNTTFIIPFYQDSDERLENLKYILKWISDNFYTNVILLEAGGTKATTAQYRNGNVAYFNHFMYEYLPDNVAFSTFKGHQLFHRTRILNIGYKMAQTPVVANWDCDVFFNPEQVVAAATLVMAGATLVYPYDGTWIDLDRKVITDGQIRTSATFGTGSLGGACLLHRERYLAIGGENEKFVSYGAEDVERKVRVCKMLGDGAMGRVPGDLYHISHPRGINSGTTNPMWKTNDNEYEKVKAMSQEELKEYIKTMNGSETSGR